MTTKPPRKYSVTAAILNTRIRSTIAGIALAGVGLTAPEALATSLAAGRPRTRGPKGHKAPMPAPQARAKAKAPKPKVAKPRTAAQKKKLAGQLKTVQSQPPGIRFRDLKHLAKLAEHRSLPKGLSSAERKLALTVVKKYRAGRSRQGAALMQKLVVRTKASGRAKLLPAVFAYVNYKTTLATHPTLDRTVRRYAFEQRKRAAIGQQLKALRKLRARKTAVVPVALVRWSPKPGKSGRLHSSKTTKQLSRTQLQHEIAYQSKQRKAATQRLRLLEELFNAGGTAQSRKAAEDSAKAADEAAAKAPDPTTDAGDGTVEEAAVDTQDNVEEAAQEAIDEAEEAVNEAIDEAEEAVNEAIDEAEEAVNDVIDEVEESVNDLIDEAEEAVNEAIDEAEEAVNEAIDEAEEAVNEAAEAGTIDVDDDASLLEGLLALADQLSRECIDEQEATSCEDLAAVSSQIATLLNAASQ